MTTETTNPEHGGCYFDPHEKYHSKEYEVPAVKILGITVRKAYMDKVIIVCPYGENSIYGNLYNYLDSMGAQ